ncbi:MAG: Hint domain-containing protein [Pelagimonas sp.]|jgi:hypothetical protein|nr:Hint domain-containing protein [Pelagimonas sp.]
MPIYNVSFYANRPSANGFTSSGTFTYTGASSVVGSASITDNEPGIEGLTLDDDNNGAETATADVTVGGLTSSGSRVDAEISYLIRDNVTAEEFVVVEFDVEQGAAAGDYTLSEQPLVNGRSYTVITYNSNPDATVGAPAFRYNEYVCFAPGTVIETPTGNRKIETLHPGDLVHTLGSGPQPLIWIGKRHLRFNSDRQNTQKPITIRAHAFGQKLPKRDLTLSPQHRLLLATPQGEVLAPVKGLLAHDRLRQLMGKKSITYISLMTPAHEVIFANGLAVESFWPGRQALMHLSNLDRLRMIAMFPGVTQSPNLGYGPPARPLLPAADTARIYQTSRLQIRGSQGRARLRSPLTAPLRTRA